VNASRKNVLLNMISIAKDSVLLACAAMGLTGLVFGVYHFLQPLGITLYLL